MKLMRRALVVGLAGVLACGCAGEKSPVTADNARKVTKGMARAR